MTIMLERTTESKARELGRCAMSLTNLLKPLLILAIGSVVLAIVPAVMMQIIELSNLAQ